MNVPDEAEEMAVIGREDGDAFGVWRSADGCFFVAGYHCGPSGDVLFRINRDGTVDGRPELHSEAIDRRIALIRRETV